MDPRRLLIPALCGLLLSGCATLRGLGQPPAGPAAEVAATHGDSAPAAPSPPAQFEASISAPPTTAVVAESVDTARAAPAKTVFSTETPYSQTSDRPLETPQPPLADDHRMGAVQVFAWSPGRVFKVRAAPLRVTTLSLPPGEALLGKAAGDTVRWQIGEVRSGAGGPLEQVHVVLKPLTRGLETNLILTTSKRVYLIDLVSTSVGTFDPAVSWTSDPPAPLTPASEPSPELEPAPLATRVALPLGALDAGYRIEPQGRRAPWTPTAVFSDGLRTFITFDPDMQAAEAPVLFAVTSDGERRLVNYRQVGGLYVVDRVLDRAELRLGDRRPQVVTIRRIGEGRA